MTCTGPSPTFTGVHGRLRSLVLASPIAKAVRGGDGNTVSLFVTISFEQLDSGFLSSSPNITGADVVIIGEDSSDFPVEIYALDPVLFLRPLPRNCNRLLRSRGARTLLAR